MNIAIATSTQKRKNITFSKVGDLTGPNAMRLTKPDKQLVISATQVPGLGTNREVLSLEVSLEIQAPLKTAKATR